jgi:Flp pilus assembly protein TadD
MSRPAFLALWGLLAASCRTPGPIPPQALHYNAECARYLEAGDLAKAETNCKLSCEFDDGYPDCHNNLCVILLKRGELDQAKKECIKALRLFNDFAIAHNNLGTIYVQERSWGKAHDAFTAALKVNPGYVEARYNLCLSLVYLRRHPDARSCYDTLIATNPLIADGPHGLCILDIESGSFSSAISECTRAIELDPRNAGQFLNLGRAYQGAGRNCEAQQAYQGCLELDDGRAECRDAIPTATSLCAAKPGH